MCSSLPFNCNHSSFDSNGTRNLYDDRDSRVRHVKCTTPRTPHRECDEDDDDLSQMTEYTPVTPPMISQQVAHPLPNTPHDQASIMSTNSHSHSQSLTSSSSSTNRIIAPNVSKLSPSSVVAIKIKSQHEEATVMCSVDVLKMRSGYFLQLLERQERTRTTTMLSPPTPAAHGQQSQQQVQIQPPLDTMSSCHLWRERLETEDASPFEAAAFLESLHESRTAYAGEWNQCWARLR